MFPLQKVLYLVNKLNKPHHQFRISDTISVYIEMWFKELWHSLKVI